MISAPGSWWGDLVDRWVRLRSRGLDDATLLPRKLLHTSLIAATWPLLHLDWRLLVLILLASCLTVVLTQRRVPYASLALLILLVIARRLAVAGAWAVFTAGDGLSAISGRLLGGPKLSWNPNKTWCGSLTFIFAAGAATFFLLRVDSPDLGAARSLLIAAAVAIAGAVVESLDVSLDDNFSVILVAGLVLQSLLTL